jgi:hypothetical protein
LASKWVVEALSRYAGLTPRRRSATPIRQKQKGRHPSIERYEMKSERVIPVVYLTRR